MLPRIRIELFSVWTVELVGQSGIAMYMSGLASCLRAAELYASRSKIRDPHACGPLNSPLSTVLMVARITTHSV